MTTRTTARQKASKHHKHKNDDDNIMRSDDRNNNGLPLHYKHDSSSGSTTGVILSNDTYSSNAAAGRNNTLLMGAFAIVTFLVMFLVDPAKLKEMMINDNGGTASKNHLSWANLNIEKRAQRKANLESNKNGSEDDDSYTTIAKQVSRQSVLLDLMQENKDKHPESLQVQKTKGRSGSNGGTSP